MTRESLRHPGGWVLSGTLLGVALVVVTIASLTRTDWGREQVLAFTLTTLGGRLNGELVVERVDGNLLTGARLYEVTIRGADGYPLLAADSAYINYEVPTFLGGDAVIRTLVLYDSQLRIRKLPGDTLWNFQQILADTTPGPGPAEPRATLIEELRMVNGEVTVLQPFLPEEAFEDLALAARDSALRVALSDTARLVVAEVPGGYLRTFRIRVDEAELTELFVAPDERGGTYLQVAAFAGEVRLWRDPPMRVTAAQGDLALREGIFRYRAPVIELPDSRFASEGVVDLREGAPAYDLAVATEQAQLADLQWLYPPLPERGETAFQLAVETRPEGLLLLAREFRIETPDTRVAGTFGMVTGDTLRFVGVDLEAEPLSVPTVEQMLPVNIPVEGLRIGSVTIRGARG